MTETLLLLNLAATLTVAYLLLWGPLQQVRTQTKTERDVLDFVRASIQSRLAEVKTGSGRAELRARLAARVAAAATRSGRPNGAQGADDSAMRR